MKKVIAVFLIVVFGIGWALGRWIKGEAEFRIFATGYSSAWTVMYHVWELEPSDTEAAAELIVEDEAMRTVYDKAGRQYLSGQMNEMEWAQAIEDFVAEWLRIHKDSLSR